MDAINSDKNDVALIKVPSYEALEEFMNHIERGQDYVMNYFSAGDNLHLCLDLARTAHQLGSIFMIIYLEKCNSALNISNSLDVLRMALDISHIQTIEHVIYTILQDFRGFKSFSSNTKEYQTALRTILAVHLLS